MRYWMLDAHGEPVPTDDVLEWARWFGEATETGARILAHDRDEREGAPEVLVSTVFLGLNHSWVEDGPPLLWETMILGGIHNGYQRRYHTRAAAIEGHQIACALMNASTTEGLEDEDRRKAERPSRPAPRKRSA